jgi:phospholipid/cholesterol/gamma-HCH transport system substrate-binding protein
MKDTRKTEVKVGLTVLIGIIVFIWIFSWAKNLSLQSSEQVVKVNFQNVSGLEIGDQVTVNGLRKGFVKEMTVKPNNILVELSVSKDIVLKEDATFAISMLDLMGGKKVEIFPGSNSNPLDLDKTYIGTFYADIPSVMSLFGSVQDDLITLLKDLKISIHSMNKYLSDEQLASDVRKSLNNLLLLSNKLDQILTENRNDIKALTSNAVELTQKSNKLISDNEANISKIVSNLKTVFEKSDTLLVRLNTLTKETINKENNLGQILYDKELLQDLKQTLKQANELTSILVEQLKEDGIKVDANIF